MKTLTVRQAKAIDIKAREELGISTLVLMENAGRAVAEEALKMLQGKKSVAIFCGKGNNGGDGFVVARHLLNSGIKTDIFLAGRIEEAQGEARVNLDILMRLRQRIVEVNKENLALVKKNILKYNLVIDALLGVGLSGEVRGIYRDLIGIINTSKADVLSVDIPSGLNATTGKALGCCVRADKTATFVAPKRGMVQREGAHYCGRIVVKGLGIPFERKS